MTTVILVLRDTRLEIPSKIFKYLTSEFSYFFPSSSLLRDDE